MCILIFTLLRLTLFLCVMLGPKSNISLQPFVTVLQGGVSLEENTNH